MKSSGFWKFESWAWAPRYLPPPTGFTPTGPMPSYQGQEDQKKAKETG